MSILQKEIPLDCFQYDMENAEEYPFLFKDCSSDEIKEFSNISGLDAEMIPTIYFHTLGWFEITHHYLGEHLHVMIMIEPNNPITYQWFLDVLTCKVPSKKMVDGKFTMSLDVALPMINKEFRFWKSEYEKNVKKGDFKKIGLNQPNLKILPWLSNNMDKLNDDDFWEVFNYGWSANELPYQYRHLIDNLMKSRKMPSSTMVIDDDENVFEKLPKVVKVFRGVHINESQKLDKKDLGNSWTTCKKIARKFTKYMGVDNDKKYIISGKVDKDKIISFINSRNELECIFELSELKDLKTDLIN